MLILGIDPGLQLTGYGYVRAHAGEPDGCLVEAGVIRLDRKRPMADRLVDLHRDLAELLDQMAPDTMVVEKLYAHYAHPTTAIGMGHARGVILLAARQRGITVREIGATEVKKALVGHGHASKRQIQLAVQAQCGLPKPPSPQDVADAIAIALVAARRHSNAYP